MHIGLSTINNPTVTILLKTATSLITTQLDNNCIKVAFPPNKLGPSQLNYIAIGYLNQNITQKKTANITLLILTLVSKNILYKRKKNSINTSTHYKKKPAINYLVS